MRLAALVTTAVLGLLLGTGAAPWAAAPTGETIDGIHCDQAEGSLFHIHQHLALVSRGRPVDVAGDVGRPILASCIYWLHTHATNGIIHVESPVFQTFTLGQFFDVWGEPLSRTVAGPVRGKAGALRIYVDGQIYRGDPRKIQLAQHTDITIEAGPPFAKPMPFTDWQGQ